jgi:hypothetical protein
MEQSMVLSCMDFCDIHVSNHCNARPAQGMAFFGSKCEAVNQSSDRNDSTHPLFRKHCEDDQVFETSPHISRDSSDPCMIGYQSPAWGDRVSSRPPNREDNIPNAIESRYQRTESLTVFCRL